MNLDEMSRAELLEEAERRGIRGVKDKAKAAIREAIESDLTVDALREQTESDQGRPASQEPDVPPAAAAGGDGAEEKQPPVGAPLTPAQRDKLLAASDDSIQAVLADPMLPQLWRVAFEGEWERRQRQAKAQSHASRMATPVQQYEIVKGGRFVVDGRVCQLHTGGVLTDQSHNLEEVRRQGIEIRPLDGQVLVVEDQLGRITTRVVRQEQAQERTGTAPRPD